MTKIANLQKRTMGWVDARYPQSFIKTYDDYFAPKNFNTFVLFWRFLLVVLANQIITGIWLAIIYLPTAEGRFASIHILCILCESAMAG